MPLRLCFGVVGGPNLSLFGVFAAAGSLKNVESDVPVTLQYGPLFSSPEHIPLTPSTAQEVPPLFRVHSMSSACTAGAAPAAPTTSARSMNDVVKKRFILISACAIAGIRPRRFRTD